MTTTLSLNYDAHRVPKDLPAMEPGNDPVLLSMIREGLDAHKRRMADDNEREIARMLGDSLT